GRELLSHRVISYLGMHPQASVVVPPAPRTGKGLQVWPTSHMSCSGGLHTPGPFDGTHVVPSGHTVRSPSVHVMELHEPLPGSQGGKHVVFVGQELRSPSLHVVPRQSPASQMLPLGHCASLWQVNGPLELVGDAQLVEIKRPRRPAAAVQATPCMTRPRVRMA